MGNDELIRMFLKKHHYDGNIIVQTRFGNTWDDVESIICNEKDIPSKKSISLDDIQYDIISEYPEGLFYQWLDYRENNGELSYKEWITTSPDSMYEPKDVDNSEMIKLRKDIEDSIDNTFKAFEDKYKAMVGYDSDDDEFDDED